MKTRKIFDSNYHGHNIIIEYHDGKTNPYHIIRKYYKDGWHRKQLEKYADFNSCLLFISDYYNTYTNPFIG